MTANLSTSGKVRLVAIAVLLIASGATIWAGLRNRPEPEPPSPTTPETALAELKAGNERFVKSQRTRSLETRSDAERRKQLARDPQRPIAAVLSCSDSRVVPEFIFDQGLGRVFDVSDAGNVVNNEILGSLEYAVEQLHVPLIVAVGHKGCGAVSAVASAGKDSLPIHLNSIQDGMTAIRAEVQRIGPDRPADFLSHLCGLNAAAQARRMLVESAVLRQAVQKKETGIAVGLYDMESGRVEWQEFDPDAEK
jgi:carbonic anhydrase